MDATTLDMDVAHRGAPGRLRLSVPGIRGRSEAARALERSLMAGGRFSSAEARPGTGSVILRFDAALGHDAALAAARAALRIGGAESADDDRPRGRRPAKPPAGPRPRSAQRPPWHALSPEEIVARLDADAERGLAADEASERLRRHGENVMPRDEPPSSLKLLAKQFQSLPVLMLGASAFLSMGTGGVADAVATLSVVAVNGVLGFATEGQAERTIHELMDVSRTPACVVRDGAERTLPANLIVPGDLLALRSGTRITADARLLAADGLMVDESALTGESMPVRKRVATELDPETPVGDRETMVHAGTIVAEGTGRAIVVATGAGTEAASIQALTAGATRPRARVEEELDRLGARLALASLAACGLFVGVGLLRGHALPVILKDALALAVAAVPEGLPMVATSTLSLGLRRMERRGILIRQMNVVESIGALQTVCLDKTGTLTQNRMAVAEATAGTRIIEIDDAEADRDALRPLGTVALLNNAVATGTSERLSQTEQAIVAFAEQIGLDREGLIERHPPGRVIERKPGRPWMATIHEGEEPMVTLKGSPEAILERCSHVEDGDGRRRLDEDDRRRILEQNDRLASRPARVLAFASGDEALEGDDPRDLTFLGLVGMTDPIRPDAPALIRRLHAAGIDTVLITGDQGGTAAAIARELDLGRGGAIRVIDSTELTDLSPDLLASLARDTHVFARVASHQKLAIVRALQASGRIVAMTGDGVNDGPALAAADVGIAMGESGADLARDVANVVIRDDRLETLIQAIAQGRAIYRNIRRSLEFLIATNMSEIAVSIVEAAHGPGELETPMELLWINLVTDVLPGLGLALADPDRDVMEKAPRLRDEPIVPRDHARRMALDSGMIAASALVAHFIGLARHGPGPVTRGMTFLALSQGQVLYTLVCQRTDPRHLRPDAILENRTLDLALIASSALGALPFFVPPLRRLLGIAPLGGRDLALSLGLATVPLLAVLARRSVQIQIEEMEARSCETSS